MTLFFGTTKLYFNYYYRVCIFRFSEAITDQLALLKRLKQQTPATKKSQTYPIYLYLSEYIFKKNEQTNPSNKYFAHGFSSINNNPVFSAFVYLSFAN